MDLSAEINRVADEMEWGELVSTLQEAIFDLLGNTPNPLSPPPPSPPPVPAWLEPDTYPQPQESQGEGCDGCIPLEEALLMLEEQSPLMAPPSPSTYFGTLQKDIMQPSHVCNQAGASSQGQVRC